MSSVEARRKRSATEEGGLMTEHWQAEAGRSRETASPPTEKSMTHPVVHLQPTSELDGPENSDKNLRRPVSNTVRNHELHDQGPIASLSRPLMETLGLLLIDVRMNPDVPQYCGPLESSCAALFFWIDDLGMSRGRLDDMLQNSLQLRDTCLAVLVSISRFVSTSLILLISSEHRQREVLQSTGISISLEQIMNMIEYHLCQTLRMKIDTLIMLAPTLASPAEEFFDDEEPRVIQDIGEYLPEQAYANSISQNFPLAALAIVSQLGKLNWKRYNHMIHLQQETAEQELQTNAMEKARTIFHDSGLGVSLPAQSEVGLNIAESAPSVVSHRAQASHKRVPQLPAKAWSGEPFACEICNKQVRFKQTKAWKKHVFDDILAYSCFFAECSDTHVFYENSEALMTHLQDDHGMDVEVSDVTCPLCVKFTSGDRDILSRHIARHMEEIALAILPTGADSDEGLADESTSDATSLKDNEDPVTPAGESQEDPTRDPSSFESNAYGSDTESPSAFVDVDGDECVLSKYLSVADEGAIEEDIRRWGSYRRDDRV
ncbi:hypothetical protein HBH64_190360 [Parastagonospora nodorum]|nr:hypothetical protein HBI01_191830 [Parastagonospora nodorum]KAH4291992.1 hypothetical protein HBI02_194350 [Parastagonospora nodorum]KAH4323050.1 hypothetical protein HBI00_186620 [Parastagonospora nodorum]KAH4359649.1 hypothetical protein HBH94_198800 [Parastagonospora nodorum]KAH4453389.1 hypothetical protein HBH90_184130 [Parastagonospora nodorum]